MIDKEEFTWRDRKNGKQKIVWMLKSLLFSYVVTGMLLALLTVLLYKFELDEQLVSAGNCRNLCIGDYGGRTGDRKACQSPKVLMGAWFGCGIFCFADADYTWRLPYAERECDKYDNCVHSVFGRRMIGGMIS